MIYQPKTANPGTPISAIDTTRNGKKTLYWAIRYDRYSALIFT